MTNTQDTQDTQRPTEGHKQKDISTNPVMYIQQLPVLHWITYWYKDLLYRGPKCLCNSKITHSKRLCPIYEIQGTVTEMV